MTNDYAAASSCGNPQEKTVLIASDDETLRELLHYIVQKEGFRIEKADSDDKTIDKARTLRPALILLGLTLHDSYKTLRELQTDDAVSIPIILLSNRQIDPSTAELLRQEPNVKGLFQQPANSTNLVVLLHRLLRTRPPRQKEST